MNRQSQTHPPTRPPQWDKSKLREQHGAAVAARQHVEQEQSIEAIAATEQQTRRQLEILRGIDKTTAARDRLIEESKPKLAELAAKTTDQRERWERLLAEIQMLAQEVAPVQAEINRVRRQVMDACVEVEGWERARDHFGKTPDEIADVPNIGGSLTGGEYWHQVGGNNLDLRAVPQDFPEELRRLIKHYNRGLTPAFYDPGSGRSF